MITVQPLPISVSTESGETFIFPTVIKTTDELILVDAGYPGQADALFAAAAQKGFDLNKLTKIVLTHHDFDHVGSVKEMKTRCPKAEVVASEQEAPFIEGKKKPFRLQQAEAMFSSLPEETKEGAAAFEAFLKSIAACDVDRRIKNGDRIDAEGLVVVMETPGHTRGHISVVIPALQTVIAGDAVMYENGELLLANPHYAFDVVQAKASAEKIRQMKPSTIICYHGGTCQFPQPAAFNL
jgi:glyoxylase-like metal-dependent hydrolase (beta-lactamase superfamily II)